jgi:hypothetical protein
MDEIKGRKSASHGEAGYPRAAFDAYFTPQWCTELLCRAVRFGPETGPTWIWEPACGNGAMVDVLRCAGYWVDGSDLTDHGFGETGVDFLTAKPEQEYAAIVTNPPFGTLARQFVVRALEIVKPQMGMVAVLQRHEFDAPKTNWPLFKYPYAMKLILPRRPKWSSEDKASPRFPFAWYVFDYRWTGEPGTRWLEEHPNNQKELL